MSDDVWPKRSPPGETPEWGIGHNKYPAACALCEAHVPIEEGVVMPRGVLFDVVCETCWNDDSIPNIQTAIHRKQWNKNEEEA